MKTMRLLLPFTHGVDMEVLEYAVQFAKSCQAILVPLALIPLAEQQWAKGPRLEAIAQANDFLEAVKFKAARAGVPIERFDVVTRDVAGSINAFVQEMACEGILLFLQGGITLLLQPDVARQLLDQTLCKLYIVRLRPKESTGLVRLLQERLSRWLGRGGGQHEQWEKEGQPAAEMISLVR